MNRLNPAASDDVAPLGRVAFRQSAQPNGSAVRSDSAGAPAEQLPVNTASPPASPVTGPAKPTASHLSGTACAPSPIYGELTPAPSQEGNDDETELTGLLPSSAQDYDLPPAGSNPRLDKAFIHALAVATPPNAEEEVSVHHSELHTMARGGERGALEAMATHLKDRGRQIDGHVRALRRNLAAIARYLDTPHEAGKKPWSLSSRLGFILLSGLAAVFALFDVHAGATALQESGLATFVAQPWRAWAMSSAPLVIAMVAKALTHLLESRAAKKAVSLMIALVSISAAVAWAFLFSMAFPGMAQSPADILGDPFAAETASAGAPTSAAQWLVFLQILAGGFGAAVMSAMALDIWDAHQISQRKENPQYTTTRRDLEAAEKVAHQEAERLGRVEGRLCEIAAEDAAFRRQAVACFCALKTIAERDRERLNQLLLA